MPDINDNELTYTRGATDITVTSFTPEKVDVEQMQALGIALITEKWQDFVFDASELSGLTPSEPAVGDVITWGTSEFRVSPLMDEAYRFTTSSRKRVRVHARQIK